MHHIALAAPCCTDSRLTIPTPRASFLHSPYSKVCKQESIPSHRIETFFTVRKTNHTDPETTPRHQYFIHNFFKSTTDIVSVVFFNFQERWYLYKFLKLWRIFLMRNVIFIWVEMDDTYFYCTGVIGIQIKQKQNTNSI